MRALVREAWVRLRGGDLTPSRAAASLALGLFVGAFPLYGLQAWICLAIALLLRLDFVLSFLGTWVNNPITGVFIVALEIEVGAWLATGRWIAVDARAVSTRGVGSLIGYATVGSLAVGAVLALVGAAVIYGLVARKRGRVTPR